MSRVVGQAGAVSISDGGTSAADANLDPGPSRIPVLHVGAAIACIATIGLATLPSLSSPNHPTLASQRGPQSRPTAGPPISVAPAASASIGVSSRGLWPVRRAGALLVRGGGIHTTFTASGLTCAWPRERSVHPSLPSDADQRGERLAAVDPASCASSASNRPLHPAGLEIHRRRRERNRGDAHRLVTRVRNSR